MEGSTPGNGKSSPFGNGRGGTLGGKSMANDFTKNPGGGGTKRAPANPMDASNPQRKLNPEADLQRNPKDAAPGGGTAADAAGAPPRYDIGAGSPGARKPFSG